jgi:RNA polymerase sigma-70 factor (ECF subfamily)
VADGHIHGAAAIVATVLSSVGPGLGVACKHAFTHTLHAMRDDGEASDETLMIAYRDGDAGAFECLYRRHRGGLYRFLLRQCGGAAVAEELFQDVWMSLIRARDRYVPQARFATYLYHVAHNRLIDHFRRSMHRPSMPEHDEDEVDPVELIAADPSEQPEAQLQSKARIERFSQLLSELPSAQREAFVMREEGGLNVDEIAQATGVNPETAKSRLRYAVAKLRRGLQELM